MILGALLIVEFWSAIIGFRLVGVEVNRVVFDSICKLATKSRHIKLTVTLDC